MEIVAAFLADTQLFQSLLHHHVNTFIELYERDSKGKEKYLNFQIDWHIRCSMFLLPQNTPTDVVIKDCSTSTEDIRSSWLAFCCSDLGQNFSAFTNVMITFSSSVYAVLLSISTLH